MGELVRTFDWATTALGPISAWPQSLLTAVAMVLSARQPMLLWWGPQLIQFYNDAYRQGLGHERHPTALGQPAREFWAETWGETGPLVDAAWAGETTSREDDFIPVTRADHQEDAYWNRGWSPVRDETGGVGGILVTMQETTRQVLAARRSGVLRAVAAVGADGGSERGACERIAAALARHGQDLRFIRLYLREGGGGPFRLNGEAGDIPPELARGTAIAPEGDTGAWAVEPVLSAVGPVVVSHWAGDQAMLVPFKTNDRPASMDGVLVAGVSPRLALDDDYREFLSDLAAQIGRSVGTVRAHADAEAREESLRGEIARLGALFAEAPGFLAVLRGPELIFELANPTYLQLVGHREVLGKPAREALPEIAGQGFFELLKGVYRTGEPFVGSEMRMQLQRVPGASPEEHYFDFVYQAIRDRGGVIWGILATGHDVTELVRSRQAAEHIAAERDAGQQKLLTVLEQSPLAMVIAEAPSGRLLYANPKAAELLGGESHGDRLEALMRDVRAYRPDGRPLTAEEWPLARALRHGEAVELETVRIERAGARRAEISVNAAPVRNAEGQIIAAVAFFRDVTVESRREQQLRDAQRLQSVGTLAGGVAHEINNQMTVVLSFGEFILEALGADHPQAADMRAVLQAGRRAARVSQQLVAFTRRQVFQPEDVVLSHLTAALLPVLRQLLGPDKSLQMATVSSTRRVRADRGQLEQVLINLIANARDATPTGGRVTVAIEDVTHPPAARDDRGYAIRPGEYVQLSVTDTGRGMDRETLARVFEPFFTTKPVGEGTGLGLSMVYGIVKQHGGYIEADSTPGRGTAFRLYLPALVAGAPGVEDVPRDGSGQALAPPNRAPATIVVVEDEEAVRSLVVRGLERLGHTAISAPDGAAAIELLRTTSRVALVITDVIMPGMNGRQLYDALASVRPSVPVLFMSGYSADAGVVRELVPPGAPFLQKPFTTLELSSAVDVLLGVGHHQ